VKTENIPASINLEVNFMGSRVADCLDKEKCQCWTEGLVHLILFPQTIPAKVTFTVTIY